MIPGIVSASLFTPLDLYAGASVVMDFEAGVYRINGASVTAADVIDNTDTLTVDGLVIDKTVTPLPAAVNLSAGAYGAIDFAGGWTALADIVQYDLENTADPLGTVLEFWNGTLDSIANRQFYIVSNATLVWSSYYFGGDPLPAVNRYVERTTALGNGARRKMAVTCTGARLSLAFNGGSVISDDTGSTAEAPVFTSFSIGDYSSLDIDCVVKKIIIYPAISDTMLPSYTA